MKVRKGDAYLLNLHKKAQERVNAEYARRDLPVYMLRARKVSGNYVPDLTERWRRPSR